MILDPFVSLLRCLEVVIDFLPIGCILHITLFVIPLQEPVLVLALAASEQGVRRSQLEGERDVRALTRIDLLVGRVSRKAEGIAEVVRNTGIEEELVRPVLKLVCLPAQLIVKYEIVVRPFEPLSDSGCKSIHLHVLVIVQNVECKVGVGLPCIVERYIQRCRLLSEEPWL